MIQFFQVRILPIENQTFSLLKYKALMLMEHQTAKPERILKFLQIIPRNCLNKLSVLMSVPKGEIVE